MPDLLSRFEKYGVAVPEILLPDPSRCDYKKWSVIACDQFTSQPAYWKDAEDAVGGAPSTLRVILPEIYLADDFNGRVSAIHKKMDEYLNGGLFCGPFNGFILVERVFRDKDGVDRSRWGLILAVDLEKYSYRQEDMPLIRSSEETVGDRLPPRVTIRRGAPLESPHVLVLADDAEKLLIEPLAEAAKAGKFEKAYDFELMAQGGHVRGYKIYGGALDDIESALGLLMKKAMNVSNDPVLFAVGDGNHSLAAAKSYWDELKGAGGGCPQARYALVEIINLYSDAVRFEPIHRALYNADPQIIIKEAMGYFKDRGVQIYKDTEGNSKTPIPDGEKPLGSALVKNGAAGHDGETGLSGYTYQMMYGENTVGLYIGKPAANLPVAEIQAFIDHYCDKYPGVKTDYIHGYDELLRLAREENCFCFMLPPVYKDGFFTAIAANGPMPRKSFSMGEARDKRYYLEVRKITP